MDIRNWPLDRIMQLPDCCFGRRWPIIITQLNLAPSVVIEVSPSPLPEWTVIHQIDGMIMEAQVEALYWDCSFALALTDMTTVNAAQFRQCESIFKESSEVSAISMPVFRLPIHLDMRYPVHTAGRRFVVDQHKSNGFKWAYEIRLIVSSLPTEVPDWLCSARV